MKYLIMRLGTIFGNSPGMRFHTAINKFCYQAALGIPLTIWKQNYDQYRPYLGLTDCMKAVSFFLEHETYGQTFNVLTDNFILSDIIDCIKNITDVKLNLVDTQILNQQSNKVSMNKNNSLVLLLTVVLIYPSLTKPYQTTPQLALPDTLPYLTLPLCIS